MPFQDFHTDPPSSEQEICLFRLFREVTVFEQK
jgi:hypothetical protein